MLPEYRQYHRLAGETHSKSVLSLKTPLCLKAGISTPFDNGILPNPPACVHPAVFCRQPGVFDQQPGLIAPWVTKTRFNWNRDQRKNMKVANDNRGVYCPANPPKKKTRKRRKINASGSRIASAGNTAPFFVSEVSGFLFAFSAVFPHSVSFPQTHRRVF